MNTTKLQILLADDDSDDTILFEEALQSAKIDAELLTVEDGEKLLNLLLNVESPPSPHMIFLDINMPRKNGKVCLKEIKLNEKLNTIPIIIFSTSSNKLDIEETFLNGASRYIIKSDFFENDEQILKKLFILSKDKAFNKPTKDTYILKG